MNTPRGKCYCTPADLKSDLNKQLDLIIIILNYYLWNELHRFFAASLSTKSAASFAAFFAALVSRFLSCSRHLLTTTLITLILFFEDFSILLPLTSMRSPFFIPNHVFTIDFLHIHIQQSRQEWLHHHKQYHAYVPMQRHCHYCQLAIASWKDNHENPPHCDSIWLC